MKIIIGNQKSYLTKEKVKDFILKIKDINYKDNEVVVCPSDIYISLYSDVNCKIGCQNISVSNNGPSTGETTASQYKSMNVSYAIIGHSERRTNQNESLEQIKLKIQNAINENIIPILCIGENRSQKDSGETEHVLKEEILGSIEKEFANKVIYAYEPLWAISDGINPAVIPSNDEIRRIAIYIKELLRKEFNSEAKVLYGGSVNPKNIVELNSINELDGYLIGGASTKGDEFTYIIENS